MAEPLCTSRQNEGFPTPSRTRAEPLLRDVFGEVGTSFLLKYLRDVRNGAERLDCVAIKRRMQALASFESCFGANVHYDPTLEPEYGKKAKIVRFDSAQGPNEPMPSEISPTASLLRFPVIHPNRQILHMDPARYDPSTERPRTSTFRDVYTPENIIRSSERNGETKSNARLVKWSNGDVTVHIGGDAYFMQSTDTSRDPHLVVRQQTLNQINCAEEDGASQQKSTAYRSALPFQAPHTLRLATPLQSSSIGKFLAREKAKQRGSNLLQHIPLRQSQPVSMRSSAFSRQCSQSVEIVDPNDDLVIDVMAQHHGQSVGADRQVLEREITSLEKAACTLGVVDRGELTANCEALRRVLERDEVDKIQKGVEQCAALRRLYRKGFSNHFVMDNGKATTQVHPDCILRGSDFPHRRNALSQRQRTADSLRSFASAFRMENITAESARTIVNASYRGRVARDERSVYSWMDATRLPIECISSHNAIIFDEFCALFRQKGLDVDAILIKPHQPLPTIDSSIDLIRQYNAQALECAKHLLRYECIRTRPVTNSMRVAPSEAE